MADERTIAALAKIEGTLERVESSLDKLQTAEEKSTRRLTELETTLRLFKPTETADRLNRAENRITMIETEVVNAKLTAQKSGAMTGAASGVGATAGLGGIGWVLWQIFKSLGGG